MANQLTPTLCVILAGSLFVGCSQAQIKKEPAPDVHVSLASHGLPNDFFQLGTDTKCAGQIIGYRFVVWLSNEHVAVGFNISPSCRQNPDQRVNGLTRILVFDLQGNVKASRDISYEADGYGEVVADGETWAGPRGTLVFGLQGVNQTKSGDVESKSGVLLLDSDLKDVAHLDGVLEQTTLADHALVFQKGFTLRGPRTYSIIDGNPPVEAETWQEDWPVGTMDRQFGEHALAYMLCQQELRPNEYASTNVIYSGAKRHCTVNVEAKDRAVWSAPLKGGNSAAIVGLLADGTVAGQINIDGSNAGQLVVWKSDQTTQILPWIPKNYSGSVQSATANMSRYATFATNDNERCERSELLCSKNGRWFVFDRKLNTPIANRLFPKNGRAALSPDGLQYATFESGEFRLYLLPKQ